MIPVPLAVALELVRRTLTTALDRLARSEDDRFTVQAMIAEMPTDPESADLMAQAVGVFLAEAVALGLVR